MPKTEQNKQVLSSFWQNILRFLSIFDFCDFYLRANVTDCEHMFVYLFKIFQCVLSYHSSSLGRGNINGLGFHLVQEYL